MPRSAIRTGAVDLVLPLDRIAPALLALVASGEFRDVSPATAIALRQG
ncbi:MAG TPA: hypothetical protein VHM67_01800 [Gemmatimonadaceae bacterium]|nr:hypothetical protein [Gemmatimonadaceae bacterium]